MLGGQTKGITMDFEERRRLSDELNERFRRWREINRKIDRVLLTIILLAVLMAGCAMIDDIAFLRKGINIVTYHNFEELLAINPDTVAWLTVDDMHVDHPVVQGKDDYEYLNKAFTGEVYAGGTLFLDSNNSKDFSDTYNIIHGHHMDGGAMFGDLGKFFDKDFFDSHETGTLLTPTYDYDLKVIGVAGYNAYSNVYAAGDVVPWDEIEGACTYTRAVVEADDSESGEAVQILALSTCSGDMTDKRTMVFCQMINKRKHT